MLLYSCIVIRFGRPFVKRFTLCYRTAVLSLCDVGVLWPNGWMDQMKLGMKVGLGPGHIVLDGDPAPPKKGTGPNYWPMSVVDKLDGLRCHSVRS